MTIIDLWKNDIIDQILLYSRSQKKKYDNFKFSFQIASFSIITSVKLYSDRIDALSVSTEEFLSHMRNEKNRIIDKKNNFKNPVCYKNFNLCHRFERSIFSYDTNNIILRMQMPKNFNFYKKKYLFKNIFSKKKTKFLFQPLDLEFYFSLFFKNIINTLFIDINTVNIHNEKLLSKNLLQLLNIEKKISKLLCYQSMKRLGFRSNIRFKKKQKFCSIKKKMETCRTIEDYFIFLKNKFLSRPLSMISGKNKIIFKKIRCMNKIDSIKKYGSNFFLGDRLKYNKKSVVLAGLSINFDYKLREQIILEKKKTHRYAFTFFLKSPFLYKFKSQKMLGKINKHTKTDNLYKSKKTPSNNFEKIFSSLLKKSNKSTHENLKKYGSDLIPKKLTEFIEILDSGLFFIKSVIAFPKHFFSLRKNCFYLISEFFFKNKVNIDLRVLLCIKKNFFKFLKYIIFYQNNEWCQLLLNSTMDNIFFMCHEIDPLVDFF